LTDPARDDAIEALLYQFALDVVRLTERRRHPDLSPDELAWQVTRRVQGNPRWRETAYDQETTQAA
jgi:hypothetical protein